MKTYSVTMLIVALIAGTAVNTLADTHYVSHSGSDTFPYTTWGTAADNIQSAVYAAAEGDTVIVDNGTYYQGERIMVTNEIIVSSKNGADMTSVDGENSYGCFELGTNSVVDGFTITNGNDGVGGGVMCWRGGTVENCIIGGNYASSSGGGIWIREGGTVRDCTISGNESGNEAGGIKCFMGGAVLTNCVISDNWAYWSGGGVSISSDGGTVQNCTINRNSVDGNGGGVYCNSGTLIVNSIISSNSGIGVFCNNGGVVSNCTIVANRGLNGAGMFCSDGGEAIHCKFTDNIAGNQGGGVYCSGGTIDLCVFTGNHATNNGGGVLLRKGSSLNNSLIYGNRAIDYRGGGVRFDGDGEMNNCTISSNIAGSAGGGFSCDRNDYVTNRNSIIYLNTSLSGNEHNYNIYGSYGETNCIFQNCCTTPLNNLPPNSTGCIDGAPEFVDMYVGNFRLVSISPCINAGNNAYKVGNYDLDGNDRISGGTIDMGAYEYVTSSGSPYKLFVQSENPSGIPVDASDDITGLGGGTTTFIRTYNGGALVELDAPASAGGKDFSYWLLDGVIQGGSAILPFNMTKDRTAKAIYGAAGDVYYVSLNGTHTYPYEDWETAATNIQSAVDAAAMRLSIGATVLVTNGTYFISSRIVVTNSVNVQSVNGAAVTHVNANRSDGCFLISDGTTLDGFTITNGYAWTGVSGSLEADGAGVYCDGGGIVKNCAITGNEAHGFGGGIRCLSGGIVMNCSIIGNDAGKFGGGVNCNSGGSVSNCIIMGNTSLDFTDGKGGGIYCWDAGDVSLCTISGNSAGDVGGGIYISETTVNNCAIFGNSAGKGGGVYSYTLGLVNNCTISGNEATYMGGGIYNGVVHNSIVYFNSAPDGPNYIDNQTFNEFRYNCLTPDPGGTGNITNDPKFVDSGSANYRLSSSSPCINAGTNIYAVGSIDLDGLPRITDGTVDMGSYEYIGSQPGLNTLTVESQNPNSGVQIGAIPEDNYGNTDGITSFIRIYSNDATVNLTAPMSLSGNDFSHWLLDGNNEGSNSELALIMISNRSAKAVYTGGGTPTGDIYYVSLGGTHTYPYTNWVTAANDIQSAVDAAESETGNRAMVLVTNGTYILSSRVVVTNNLIVGSVNGAAVTIINGNRADGCLLISDGTTLDGFTITNGYATGSGREEDGGGVYCDEGGVVQNCVITGNEAGGGGGVYCNKGGIIVNCSILGNNVNDYAGGVRLYYGGIVSNCIIMGNTATNSASGDADGGGIDSYNGGVISHSIINGNSAGDDGGGIWCNDPCIVNLCTISDNSAGDDGGGIFNRDATINNCALFGNSSAYGGGVICYNGGRVNNCTITDNTATDEGGGVYSDDGNIHNSIAYFNSSPDGANYYKTGTGNVCEYSCLAPNPGGTGNITTDPQFIDTGSDNYRLGSSSPCINQGNNSYVVGAIDLDGLPRIIDGTVDMGAYEYIGSQPGINILTVESQNPNSGVQIGAVPVDNYGNTDGITTFIRIYSNAAIVNLTAPISADGNDFSHWLLDGNNEGSNTDLALTMISNRTAKAVYSSGGIPTSGVYYVSLSGVHTYPYTNWLTAANDIQSAVDAAESETGAGAIVLVTNGTYDTGVRVAPGFGLSNRVVVISNILVRSVNGASSTVILGTGPIGANAVRCVYLKNGAVLDGFTLSNGFTLTTSGDDSGGGAFLDSNATLSNCVIEGNAANILGGGVMCNYGGMVVNCRIRGNSTGHAGAGVCALAGGAMRGCIISDNKSSDIAGGVHTSSGGTIENCTIVNNNAASSGGGVDSYAGGTMINSIVWGNTGNNIGRAPNPNQFNCIGDWTGGGYGNITNDPQFLSSGNFYLKETSPCIDAGTNMEWMTGATDLVGRPRIIDGTVDMGAYECPGSQPGIHTLTVESQNPNSDVQISAAPEDNYGSSDGSTIFVRIYSNGVTVNLTAPTSAGGNDFSYWLLDGMESETNTILEFTMISNRTATAVYGGGITPTNVYYVSLSGAHTYPYTNWSAAANDIQSAVDAAEAETGDGAMVLVTNGTYNTGMRVTPGYALFNRVVVINNILIRSVNGASSTVILGRGPIGPNAIRCVFFQNGATLDGFTLSNGATLNTGDEHIDQSGGGMFCNYSGTIVNCKILGNKAAVYGGGVECYYGGNVSYCTISGNSSGDDGGGIDLESGGNISFCTINGNSAGDDGGGIWCGDSNIVNLCTISDNSAGDDGGGIYNLDATINNCALFGNLSAYGGGVICYNGGRVNNCTITDNTASDEGGGVYSDDGNIHNSIVYFNNSPDGSNYYNTGSGNVCEYSCLTPDPGGTGNITAYPQFVDAGSGNYRLNSSSPCINQGNNSYAMGSIDLDGLPRIIDGTVDMGAYEYFGNQPDIHSLTVESQNPDSGVQISASPEDNYGCSDGSTIFVRIYSNGVTVNLTSPTSVGGNDFSYWLLDGVESETNTILEFTMISNRIATAVYGGGIEGSLMPTNPVPANGAVDVPTYQQLLWQLATNGTQTTSVSSDFFNTAITRRAFSTELLAGNQPLFTTVDNQDNAGTGNPDDDMDVSLGPGSAIAPIEFDILYTNSTLPVTAQLLIYAKDIDETKGEIDDVYFNGTKIGSLTGANQEWSTTVFDIDPSLVVQGNNLVKIEIAVNWVCTVDWGRLVINNESAGEANIRYAEQNKPVYSAGESVIISIDLDTLAASQDLKHEVNTLEGASQNLKLEVNILEPGGTNIAGTTVNRTVTSHDTDPFNVTLDLPGDAGDGVYHIQLLLYDISNQFQTLRMIPFGVGNADVITYDVFFGSASNDLAQIKTNITYAGCFPGMLTESADYWWQVIAKDSSEQGTGSYWSFTTIGGGTSTGDIYYVSLSGAHTYPYTNWATAANDIQSAVDAAEAETGAGAMVLVTNGTYILSSRVVVTNGLIVGSVNGAAVTHVNGNRADGCFMISDGTTLDGFTITNGYSTGTGWEEDGGGVYCDEGGIVQNCTISGNEADEDGGGIYFNRYGKAVNCSIVGNAAGSAGGGANCYYGGVVSNCIIMGNTTTNSSGGDAGGVECYYGGNVSHCTISGNIAVDDGGGVECYYGGSVTLCTIKNNSAGDDGGGIWANSGNIDQCTLSGNSAGDNGGGIWCNSPCLVNLCTINDNNAVDDGGGIYNQNTIVNNCAVVNNSAERGGGVMCRNDGRVNNCTMSGNEATVQGGGVYCYENSTIHNSIVYFNSSPEGPEYYNASSGNEYEYSCLTPDSGGTGNITTDPQFVDAGSDNYRLGSSSPCINQGNNSYAVGSIDLDGLPRITDGTVDMGAYEYFGSQPDIHSLTVESQNPDSGVQISAAPEDNYGNTDGATTFVRIYSNGVTVNLTAPLSAGGNSFSYWLLDGVESETNTILAIPMNTNRIAKAVYGGGIEGSLMPTNPVPANGAVDVPTYQLFLWQLATNGTQITSVSSDFFNNAITRHVMSTEYFAGNQPLFTTVDNQDNAGTGNPDDDMDVSLGPGDSIAPIEFDISYTNSTLPVTAQLLIYAKDIDETKGEIDDVYFNGTKIGSLTGENQEWSTTVFDIDPSLVVQGNNLVKIEIAVNWVCTVDWGRLVINNESAGDANIRYAEQNKPVYSAGESVIISIDLDTIAASQDLKHEVNILEGASQNLKLEVNILEPGGTNIAGTTVNRTVTSRDTDPFNVTLNLPGDAGDGVYHIQLLLYDISNQFQTLRMIPFGVGDADVITYDVFFGGASNDLAQIKTNLTYAGCFPGMLTESADYWWQVIAKDSAEQGTGSLWSFTTIGGGGVPPFPPSNVAASDGTYTDRIIISWNASGGATKYRVFRDGTNIAEVSDTSYEDTSVTMWQNYNYFVQAGNNAGWSGNSATNSGYAGDLTSPTGVTASDGMFTDRIRVTWNPSVGATKYQLYRDGNLIANTTDTTYDDTSVVQWQSYEYTVKAGNDYVWTPVSSDSDTGYAGSLAPPTNISASDGTYNNRVRITWNPSVGATAYRLYRDGVQISEITGTSYDDMSVTLWQTYEYSVKAGNGSQWTPISDTDTGYSGNIVSPTGMTASDGAYTDRVRVSWDPSAGATTYRVYRDGVQIAETSLPTYDDMSVVLWQVYDYSVSAGNSSGWTPQSTNNSGYAGDLVTPAGVTASDGSFFDRVRVTWNISAGATKYRIYRDGAQIAEITGTSYDDTSVTAWQSYKYSVKAGNSSGWTPLSIPDSGYSGNLVPPTGIKASDGTYTNRVRISWNPSSGASKYQVFRDGLFLIETTATTYEDTSVTQWQTYQYTVKAGNSSSWTPLSTPDTGYAGSLAPPTNVAASDGTYDNRVRITWSPSVGATSYRLYRDGVQIAEITSTSYDDMSVTLWQKYQYSVKAGNGSKWTPESDTDTGYAGDIVSPTGITASDGVFTNRVRVSWNASTGATTYRVYRNGVQIAETSSSTHDDMDVVRWQVYDYTVSAGNASGWTPQSTNDSGYAGNLATPANFTASDGLFSDRVRVTWNASAGATKYRIYRDNASIAEITGTTYDDISVTEWQSYKYAVKAGNSSGWTPLSIPDTGYSGDMVPPTSVSASDGTYTDRVRITWNPSSGATRYQIFRDGLYLMETTGTTYEDTSVTQWQTYEYSVKAGNSSFWTPHSVPNSGYAGSLGTPTDVTASDGTYADRVYITWTASSNATKYSVHRDGIYIAETSGTNYNDTTVAAWQTYEYSVKAGNVSGWTPFSQPDTGYAGNIAPPTDLAASDGLYIDRVRLTWNPSSGATKYQVFRDNLYISDTIGTTYDDTSALAWQVYSYTVKAGNSSFWTPNTTDDSGYAGDIAPPSGLNASDGLYSDRISVTWNSSSGATKYELYRDNLYIAEISGTNYNDTSITPAQLYSYSVRAGNASFWTPTCKSDSGFALPSPTGISATDGTYNDKVDVTWSNVPSAIAYNIYRSDTNDAAIATLLGTSLSNIYSDATVIPGVKYYFWIKATANVGDSELSESDTGYAQLISPTGISATDGTYNDKVDVTWSNVPSAIAYNIYRSDTNDAAIATLLGTSLSNIYSDATVIPGVKYYFWIKATANVGDSELSESNTGYAQLISPTGISATDGTYNDKVDVTWSNVPSAIAYNIYRSDTNDAAIATLLGTSLSNIYSDATVTPGIKYYFWIKATANVGYSELSESDTGYAKLMIPAGVSASDGTYSNMVRVTWNNVAGAISYKIYRGTTDVSTAAVMIGELTSPYDDSSVEPAKKYYYWVKSSAAVGDSGFSVVDEGYAFKSVDPTLSIGVWKVKRGKKASKIKGKEIELLSGYLTDGCLIGIRDKDSTNIIDGPRVLEAKIKKKTGVVKFWHRRIKKEVLIKYKVKKSKIIYKIWNELPKNPIVFLVPPDTDQSNMSKKMPDMGLEFQLVPIGPSDDSGWQNMKSIIVEPKK